MHVIRDGTLAQAAAGQQIMRAGWLGWPTGWQHSSYRYACHSLLTNDGSSAKMLRES